MSDRLDFDHLVYGVPDLLAGVEQFTAATGITPVRGGRHAGYGTANFLVGLGHRRYLEIIGVDPEARDTPPRRLFGIDPARPPGLLTWAVRTDDIDRAVNTARHHGYDPGEPVGMSRRTADGDLLRWRLTPDTVEATGGLVPFLIDWGASTHPTAHLTRRLPELGLASLTLYGPNPSHTSRNLAALGVRIPVHDAPRPGMRAVLTSPNGTLTLG